MEPRRHVEQFEVIERHVTESRRPISDEAALNYIPHHSSAHIRRNGMSPLRENPILQSTPERSYSASAINNYGYDVHEVHTSGGGARVVQTHGSGNVWDPSNNSSDLMHDRSLDISGRPLTDFAYGAGISPALSATQRVSGQPQSILKNADRLHSSDENSLNRKDSYKRMQESHFENASVYGPSSQATIISRSSKGAGKRAFAKAASSGANDCCSAMGSWCSRVSRDIREAEKTPQLICGLLLILLFLLFLIILLIIFLSAAFSPYSVSSFLMYPPVCEECLKRNPAGVSHRPPSKLFVHVRSPSEIDFEMVGNQPLKSNSYTVVDFSTGYVAIADHALTDTQGRHTACFLMKLDQEALPSMDVVMDAIASTYHEVHSEYGWQEHWQYVVRQIDSHTATSKFHSTIADYASCTACYDFCFPDYAVQRREKYEDEVTTCPNGSTTASSRTRRAAIGIIPGRPQETQRDYLNNWVNWTPVSVVGRPDIDTRQRLEPPFYNRDHSLETDQSILRNDRHHI
ncbi:BRICHOS domain-containing protein C09F5.1 [Aphelenchoides fujianensis]|nr:BRICHOS domain-containing protein C09F5.1 [Aphelenchoides fujianensis]